MRAVALPSWSSAPSASSNALRRTLPAHTNLPLCERRQEVATVQPNDNMVSIHAGRGPVSDYLARLNVEIPIHHDRSLPQHLVEGRRSRLEVFADVGGAAHPVAFGALPVATGIVDILCVEELPSILGRASAVVDTRSRYIRLEGASVMPGWHAYGDGERCSEQQKNVSYVTHWEQHRCSSAKVFSLRVL